MKPYLIQRGTIKTNKKSHIKGIDSLVSYDYMGAAEFEFGALGKALEKFSKITDAYRVFAIDSIRRLSDNSRLFVYCHSDFEEIEKFLEINSKNPYHKDYHLHEQTYLNHVVDGDRFFGNIDFWWDIENNWFACFRKENMDLLIYALQKSAERKKALATV